MTSSIAVLPDSGEDARALLELVRSLLATVGDSRGSARLGLDASFERELGLGSLERVELVGRIERAFSIDLPEAAITTADTPRHLLRLVRASFRPGSTAGAPPPPAEAPPAEASPAEAPPARTPPRVAPGSPTAAPQPPAFAGTLLEVLDHHADLHRDRVHALLVGEGGSEDPVTYGELRRDALAVADRLRHLGLEPGGKAAIMLPTGREYLAAFLGAQLAGGVPVPLYPPFRLDRIGEYLERQSGILDNAEAEILITFERAARLAGLARDRVRSLRHVLSVEREPAAPAGLRLRARVEPGDTALLQYTSGSTSDPKGVELSHASVLANIRAAAAACELGAGDVMVSWLPLYHDMGLIGGWLMNFYYGNPTVLLSPVAFLSRPESWLRALTRYHGTISVAPNFAFDLCSRRIPDEVLAELDLSRLRAVLNGSEPILRPTLERFAERFAGAGFRYRAFFCAYGLAENTVALTFPPPARGPRIERIERRPFETRGLARPAPPESRDALEFVGVGFPVPGHEVRIADARDRPVDERVQGRLHFRGPSAFRRYYRDPEATAAVQLAGGWIDSGDLAYLADGEVFLTGRVKDLIIKGGRNYHPHELEAAAATVAGVRKGCVAAFAVPDEKTGAETLAVVAETRQTDPEARRVLARQVGEAIAGAVGVPPDRVAIVGPGAVPKTSSGKLRRRETRRRYLSGELEARRRGVAWQAAGLFLRGLPRRATAVAARTAEIAYGSYALAVFLAGAAWATAVAQVLPDGRPLRRLFALCCRVVLRLTGLFPRRAGGRDVPPGPVILAANHASYLDPFVLSAVLPVDARYVIKGEWRDGRIYGRLMLRSGHLLIDRHHAARSLAGLAETSELLARGETVMIFPEGTFTSETGLRPLKLGAFRVACDAGVPVCPIALRGTRRALKDLTWMPRWAPIEIEILEPIAPTGDRLEDVVRLRDRVADALAAHVGEPRLRPASVAEPGTGPRLSASIPDSGLVSQED